MSVGGRSLRFTESFVLALGFFLPLDNIEFKIRSKMFIMFLAVLTLLPTTQAREEEKGYFEQAKDYASAGWKKTKES